jgi:hypothetical protein
MPSHSGNQINKINEKNIEFMQACQQLKAAESKIAIWKLMQEET